jgi:ubiquinone biosynthesis protein Coq4
MEFGLNTARMAVLNKNGKRKRQNTNNSDSDEEMFIKHIGEFEDFWHLVRVVLSHPRNTLGALVNER